MRPEHEEVVTYSRCRFSRSTSPAIGASSEPFGDLSSFPSALRFATSKRSAATASHVAELWMDGFLTEGDAPSAPRHPSGRAGRGRRYEDDAQGIKTLASSSANAALPYLASVIGFIQPMQPAQRRRAGLDILTTLQRGVDALIRQNALLPQKGLAAALVAMFGLDDGSEARAQRSAFYLGEFSVDDVLKCFDFVNAIVQAGGVAPLVAMLSASNGADGPFQASRLLG